MASVRCQKECRIRNAACGMSRAQDGDCRVNEQGVRAKPSSIAEVLETDEAKGLLEAGREAGSLSTEEIALALGELELDAAQVDDFYHALEELHIEVVDGSERDRSASRRRRRARSRPTRCSCS